jgi:RimJ/RimL family protein N-acetyltransferase
MTVIDQINERLAGVKCRLDPITDGHIEQLRPWVKTPWPVDAIETVRFNIERGPNGAVYFGDQLLGIIGIAVLWPGCGEVWTILDDTLKHQRKRQLVISVRTALDIAQQSLGLRRVQLAVESAAEYAGSWPQALGFELEGTMRCFGVDGSDYLLFGRIRPCQHQLSRP